MCSVCFVAFFLLSSPFPPKGDGDSPTQYAMNDVTLGEKTWSKNENEEDKTTANCCPKRFAKLFESRSCSFLFWPPFPPPRGRDKAASESWRTWREERANECVPPFLSSFASGGKEEGESAAFEKKEGLHFVGGLEMPAGTSRKKPPRPRQTNSVPSRVFPSINLTHFSMSFSRIELYGPTAADRRTDRAE